MLAHHTQWLAIHEPTAITFPSSDGPAVTYTHRDAEIIATEDGREVHRLPFSGRVWAALTAKRQAWEG
jgi:hypothetical protein